MSTKTFGVLSLGFISLFAACGGGEAPKSSESPAAEAQKAEAAAPASGGAATGSASISGKVLYDGQSSPVEKLKLVPECAALHKDGLERQTIRVKDGGLADAVVYVKSGLSGTYPAPSDPVLLDQSGCDYIPHAIALMVGQPLKIRNSDDFMHNIHPRPQDNPEFNVSQPKKGMEKIQHFDKPEALIPVGCDVHPWMRAYISVLPNPFYTVTADDGSFTIKGLPAGEYEVEAVHGKLKTVTGKVTVKDGEAAKLDLSFKS